MLRTKKTKKLIRNVLRGLPALPFLASARRRPPSIVPIVLGAIGVAIIGGIAAVMALSPRTRYRALDAAKGGYGKVRGQIDHLVARHGESAGESMASAGTRVAERAGANFATKT